MMETWFFDFFPSNVLIVIDPLTFWIVVLFAIIVTYLIVRPTKVINPLVFERELFEEIPKPKVNGK